MPVLAESRVLDASVAQGPQPAGEHRLRHVPHQGIHPLPALEEHQRRQGLDAEPLRDGGLDGSRYPLAAALTCAFRQANGAGDCYSPYPESFHRKEPGRQCRLARK